jgi:hypothetical protein
VLHAHTQHDGRTALDFRQLHDPVELECPPVVAQLAVGDQQQFAVAPADLHRLDHPLRAFLPGVQVLHEHRAALLQRLFQLQRQQALARRRGQQAHRPALLFHRVAKA